MFWLLLLTCCAVVGVIWFGYFILVCFALLVRAIVMLLVGLVECVAWALRR